MDNPLKYFLIITAVFAAFIGVFVWGLLTQKSPVTNEYAVVDENDPALVRAKKQAAANLGILVILYPQNPDSTFIRFSFEPTKGHVEHLWGKVLRLDIAHVKVQLTRKEGTEDIYYPDELELKTERIEDWMIYLGDGTIRGGFTVQALLMKEKERPVSNLDSLQNQLGKFSDKLE